MWSGVRVVTRGKGSEGVAGGGAEAARNPHGLGVSPGRGEETGGSGSSTDLRCDVSKGRDEGRASRGCVKPGNLDGATIKGKG